MKTTIILITCCFAILLFSFQNSTLDEGAIGDVKYSVLPLDQFQALNGKGWVLMNGEPINDAWRIKSLITFQDNRIPDGRGVFIRMKDHGAGMDSEGDRPIGKFQDDEFESHDHPVTVKSGQFVGHTGGPDVGGGAHCMRINPEITTGPKGGSETRPKNIVLNAYIKVN